MAVLGTNKTTVGRHAGRVDKPERPLVGRNVGRPVQYGDRSAGKPVGRPDGPEGLRADGGRRCGRVVRHAVRADPVGDIRRPDDCWRHQIVRLRHRFCVRGRGVTEHDARSVQRGVGLVRRDRHARGRDGRAADSVQHYERADHVRRGVVPVGRTLDSRDAHRFTVQGQDGRGAARVRVVPAEPVGGGTRKVVHQVNK